ncbi:MAG: hypothetical protein HC831_14725 [Chloroflexia bacterium]|nr:hypothetical protein [Chloroflexia bacterium]
MFRKKSNPAAEIAQHGISISELIKKTYEDLNSTLKEQEFQKEFIQIVNDISPETYTMKIETDHEGELKNYYKIKAYRNLEGFYGL